MDRTQIILVAIVAQIGVFALLLGVIVSLKARRQVVDLRRRRRRTVLEPIVLRHARAANGTLVAELGAEPGAFDIGVLEALLLEQIQAVKGRYQQRLVDACEEIGLVDRRVAQLASRRWWLRADAAERLGQMRSARASAPLVAAMDDPQPEVRIRAAKALGAIGGQAAIAKLVTGLRQPSRWSAMRLADILTGLGEQAVDDLSAALPHLPDASRLLVVDIFGRVRSLKAIPVLRALLSDPHPDLRARAAHSLGQIGDPGSIPHLVGVLKDAAWPVRAMAARALGRIPGREALEPLCLALTDAQWWVRANAAEALKSKGEPGQRALLSVLDSTDAYAREQAVLMLQESGMLDETMALLVSDDPGEVDRAASIIRKLVGLKRVDLLGESAVSHPNPRVRAALLSLLGRPAEGA
jgi:HEAT repeat protein